MSEFDEKLNALLSNPDSMAQIMFSSDNIWENIDDSSMNNVRAFFSLTDFRVLAHQDQHEP